MLAQTSLDSWSSMHELGLKQKMVFDVILAFGPITNKNISKLTGLPINSVTPRTLELRTMGHVVSGPEYIDPDTRKKCVSWVSKNSIKVNVE